MLSVVENILKIKVSMSIIVNLRSTKINKVLLLSSQNYKETDIKEFINLSISITSTT